MFRLPSVALLVLVWSAGPACNLEPVTEAGDEAQENSDVLVKVGSEGLSPAQRLNVAQRMLRAGEPKRAAAALSEIDTSAEGLDLAEYWYWWGFTHYQMNDLKQAAEAFEKTLEHGEKDPRVHVNLARLYYDLQKYPKVIEHLNAVPEQVCADPSLFNLKTQTYWNTGDKVNALLTLEHAEACFPERHEFTRQRVLYLLQMHLYRKAAALGQEYLKKAGDEPNVYVALGEALRRSHQTDDALLVLDMARLRWPYDPQVLRAQAHAFLAAGQDHQAAGVMMRLARLHPEYMHEAAELQRRAGNLPEAVRLNAAVREQKKKVRQRLGLLLELQKFEQAAALEDRLSRLGLLKDQEILYAMAFTNFQIHEYDRAERYIKKLRRPDLFEAGNKLRKAIMDRTKNGVY